ncbi:MAG: bifunctional 5,10-methylenetetrahydrofolate dehydrogenase/5,10-methenyltetrahydrofolate cyclohydrolase [Planctomycetes bacterium]|nr:bifunctional 5,10-methylenetetrahydrofolate dehydrogenase/5,10-methenyltetrahydrofolate cyclohydrolase [Planctomycetota bacterium]
MNDVTPSKLMNGRSLARQIRDDVARRAAEIQAATGVSPTLATVGVGSSPSSATYARMKRKRCEQAGITPRLVELPTDTPTEKVVADIRELAADSSVHGIIVQHPIPGPIDRRAVFEAIPLEKDVDAVSSAALGRAILGMKAFASCTPKGIMRLLAEYEVELDGTHAVVIGRSPILGRPMASMLINAHATVTLCHSRTRNLPDIVRGADLLIAAVGRARFVQGDWIKPGAVVIDAGYNEGNIGDVDFDAVIARASLITPVPGGVGPMTIATLLEQTVDAAAQQLGIEV